MDIGDIREEAGSEYRKRMIYSMYAQEQWGRSAEMERLKTYLADGAAIRVWYSDAPYSRCGFYHLCTVLQKYQNEIHIVKLPEYKVRSDNSMISYSNWGEVAAEEFAGLFGIDFTNGKIRGV